MRRWQMSESEEVRRRPVIVVHGYLASKEMMIPMRSRLEKAGFDAHIAQLPPLLLGKVEPMAGLLASEIDRILGGYKVQRCDLLGVSLGGLLGLRYLQVYGGPAEEKPGLGRHGRVRRFISVGTPFKGSPAAKPASVVLGLVSEAAAQLKPDSDFIRNLNEDGLPEGLLAMSIFATRDIMAPPSACALEGAENIEVLGPPAPLTHQGLVVSNEVIGHVVEFLSRTHPVDEYTALDLEEV